jgi:redox-sensing transcriptional repressor
MNAIGRFGRYLEVIEKLPKEREHISSQELAKLTGATPSTVRQDFHTHLDKKGKSRVGYNVKLLRKTILRLLGMNRERRIVIIGGGKLGRALAQYKEFSKMHITFSAFFDNAPGKAGQVLDGIPVYHISQLHDYLLENDDINLAILAVPAEVAQETAAFAEKCGIEAFWNFSPVILELSDHVVVQSQYIGESLYKLVYELNQRAKKGGKHMELMICVGSSCHLKGSEEVVKSFKQLMEKENINRKVTLKGSFCMGQCSDTGVTIQLGDNVYKIKSEESETFFYETLLPAFKA